jgi:hypothetical protein
MFMGAIVPARQLAQTVLLAPAALVLNRMSSAGTASVVRMRWRRG